MSGYFITSTDTNVGKTTVAKLLMQYFKLHGRSVGCMKPISAGCEVTPEGLRNQDAVLLAKESSIVFDYDQINPYAFELPIAPHIAAEKLNQRIDIDIISNLYTRIKSKVDVVIVEGAGGWLVPVNDLQSMADVAAILELPVILVVGMRLGCLNHALLTAESIRSTGLPFAGWVANYIDNTMLNQQDNIDSLKKRIQANFLGSIAYQNDINNCKLEFSPVTVNQLF